MAECLMPDVALLEGAPVSPSLSQLYAGGEHPLLRAGPNASVHAYSAAQVKAAMDATLRLGGENYVFWGGREGYHTLLNTDLK